jgi:hypothetical protein
MEILRRPSYIKLDGMGRHKHAYRYRAQSNGTALRDRTPNRSLRSRKLSAKCCGDLCETSILSRSGCLVVAPRGDIGPTAIDLFLFIATRTNSGESGHDYDAVYAPILGLGVGCDVVPCRADDFETARDDRTCLAWHVEHTGKKINQRA